MFLFRLRFWKILMAIFLLGVIVVVLYIAAPRPVPLVVEQAFRQAWKAHRPQVKNMDHAILIDYRMPVYLRRLWVINPQTGEVLINTFVGHSRRSGYLKPNRFSNVPESKLSCAGSFLTSFSYQGNYGYALKVIGLEQGVNNNAFRRAIVIHPTNLDIWSAGCFTLPHAISQKVIDLTKDGALMYVHRE